MQNLSIVGTYRTCAPEGIRYLKAASVQVWLVNHSDTTAWWVSRWIGYLYLSLCLGGFWGWNEMMARWLGTFLALRRALQRGRKLRGVVGWRISPLPTYLLSKDFCFFLFSFSFFFLYIRKTTSHKQDLLPVFSCFLLLTVTHCCLLLVVVVVEVAQGQCSVV